MTFLAFFLLLIVLAEFAIGVYGDMLNLRALRPNPPEGFEEVYDPERYRKSQAYLKINTRFGWLTSVVDLAILLGFWFAGGFGVLARWGYRLDMGKWGLGPVVSGLLCMGILVAAKVILSLPAEALHTFYIETRYGFNRTTVRTFFMDRIKGAALGVVLGGPLMGAVLLFLERFGPGAWWICWAVTAAFVLIFQYIAPVWIMPLFNKYEELPEGELKTALLDLAEKAGFPLNGALVMDGSRRSTKANAFFTGFGRNKRIALFDTLIEKHTAAELTAITAHEIGHFRLRHIYMNTAVSVLYTGVMFFGLSLVLQWEALYRAFMVTTTPVWAGLLFFGILFTPVDFFLKIALNALSRKNEFAADRFAAEITGAPEALAEALKRLSADNLSNLTPHPLYVKLHHGHPPVTERVRALEGMNRGS